MKPYRKAMQAVVFAFIGNGLLALSKLIIGLLTGSISLIADAVNNLSDFLTTLVMLVGLRVSSKPADEEHPYGHERFDIIGGLIVAIILLYAGFDVFMAAVNTFNHPQKTEITVAMWLVTGISLIVKATMYLVYKRMYDKTKSELMIGGKLDSRNDVIIAIGMLVGFLFQTTFGLDVDGVLGLIIAGVIVLGAIGLLRNTVRILLGKRPSQRDIDAVVSLLDKNDTIMGYHDLLIHTYGTMHKFGSVHIELDQAMSLREAHDVADAIETEILEAFGFKIVVHLDPVDLNNPNAQHIIARLKTIDDVVSIHDLQIHHKKARFDVVLKRDSERQDEEIIAEIRALLADLQLELKIHIDRNYLLRND